MKLVNIQSLADAIQDRNPSLDRAMTMLAITEFGRFMVLNKIDRSNDRLIPSPLVDQVWQLAFILNTKVYALFCFESFSGKMLHRDPSALNIDETEKKNCGRFTVKKYQERLEEAPPTAIWPKELFRRSPLTKIFIAT
jgi:hypothetical protein